MTKIYCLEARRPNQDVSRIGSFMVTMKEGSVPGLSLRHADGCLHVHVAFFLYDCLSPSFSLFIRTPVILD